MHSSLCIELRIERSAPHLGTDYDGLYTVHIQRIYKGYTEDIQKIYRRYTVHIRYIYGTYTVHNTTFIMVIPQEITPGATRHIGGSILVSSFLFIND